MVRRRRARAWLTDVPCTTHHHHHIPAGHLDGSIPVPRVLSPRHWPLAIAMTGGREIPSTCADADRYCDRPPFATSNDGTSHGMTTPPFAVARCPALPLGGMPAADGPKWNGPGSSSGENLLIPNVRGCVIMQAMDPPLLSAALPSVVRTAQGRGGRRETRGRRMCAGREPG
jgi:hypothetical protein